MRTTGAASQAQDCELTVGSTRDDDVAKAAGERQCAGAPQNRQKSGGKRCDVAENRVAGSYGCCFCDESETFELHTHQGAGCHGKYGVKRYRRWNLSDSASAGTPGHEQ
jgi:hypothetical protein